MAGSGRTLSRAGAVARGAIGIGLLVIAVTTQHLSWWDVAAAILVLPSLAVVTTAAVNRIIGRTSLVRKARTPWSLTQIMAAVGIIVVVLGVGIALTFVSPIDGGALYAFFGLSMVIAALRGFDGCEILALPNLVLGHAEAIWCPLYSAIDATETASHPTESNSP